MSQNISRSQTRLAVDDGKPIVIDVETAQDEVYDALANERRRTVLCVLMRESVPIGLETIARKVTAQELPEGARAETTELLERVRVSLYHTHLPKLADLDLLEFDTERMTVESVADPISSANI